MSAESPILIGKVRPKHARRAAGLCKPDEHLVMLCKPRNRIAWIFGAGMAVITCGGVWIFVQHIQREGWNPDVNPGPRVMAILGGPVLCMFWCLVLYVIVAGARRVHAATNSAAFTIEWGPIAGYRRVDLPAGKVNGIHRTQRGSGVGTIHFDLHESCVHILNQWLGIPEVAKVERHVREAMQMGIAPSERRNLPRDPAADELVAAPLLREEIAQDEQVLWAGKPCRSWFYARQFLPFAGMGLIGIASAVYFLLDALRQPTNFWAYIGGFVMFITTGTLFFAHLPLAARAVRRWRYVITDRRAILVEVGPWGSASVWSWKPEQLREAQLNREPSGNGDVIFGEVARDVQVNAGNARVQKQPDGTIVAGQRVQKRPHGFIAVADFDHLVAVIDAASGPVRVNEP